MTASATSQGLANYALLIDGRLGSGLRLACIARPILGYRWQQAWNAAASRQAFTYCQTLLMLASGVIFTTWWLIVNWEGDSAP